MASFKVIGVQAIVRGASKFIGDMRAVTKVTTDSSKKIANALERQQLTQKKLGILLEEMKDRYSKLSDAKKEVSFSGKKLNADIALMANSIAKSSLKIEGLTAALGSAGGGLATVGSAISAAIPYVGIFLVAIKALQIQFKAFGKIIKLMTLPLRTIIKLFKSLATQVLPKVISFVVSLAKKIGSLLLARLKTLVSAAKEAGKAILSGLGNALKSVGSFIISTAISGLKKLADVLRDVIQIAWDGAATFQKLTIRFQGLVAIELMATGRAENFGDAMAQASVKGAELLAWIQQLAVTTPFTRRDISETVAFSMAMGFTTQKTKEMTLAIGNFVSGMGLSSNVMESIILQFGQMQAGGKLFGTELRDLARGAFVPVNEIIKSVAANLDMTAKEWQDLAARGETDIKPFFDEFIRMANTRFPNAMERMNKTLEATMQNIGEFVREFLGVKLFLPAVERISAVISEAFKNITTPTVMKAFEMAGESIGRMTNVFIHLLEVVLAIKPPIESVVQVITTIGKVGTKVTGELGGAIKVIGEIGTKIKRVDVAAKSSLGTLQQWAVNIAAFISVAADKVRGLLDKTIARVKGMETNFGTMVKNALKWGVDLMVNFAIGLVRGAASALTAAMNAISGMLSWWLESFSPPRVAPDIVKWGASAVTEWLRGFTQGDFSILKDIQSPLKAALDVLVGRGQLDEGKMRKKFINISQGLIEGLSGGGIGAGVFASIGKIGEFGAEINRLIKLELGLVTATERVKQAEDALEESRRRHTAAVLDVRKQTMEYNKLLRSGAGKDILDAQLERVNASELEREVSAGQIGVDEKRLQTAQDALGPIEEMVSLQKQLIDQLLELAQMSIMPIDAAATTKALKDTGGAIEDIGGAMDDLANKTRETQGGIGKAFEQAKDKIEAAWGELFDGIGTKWDESVGASLDNLEERFGEFRKDVIMPILAALGIGGARDPGLEGNFEQASGLEIRIGMILWHARQLYNFWKDDLKGALEAFFGEGGVLTELAESFKGVWEAVVELGASLGFGTGKGKGEQGPLTQAVSVVGDALNYFMTDILEPLLTLFTNIVLKLMELKTWLGLVKTAAGKTKDAVNAIPGPGSTSTGTGGPPPGSPGNQAGAWRVPGTGARFLHEGEMILPKSVSSAIRSSLMSPVSAPPVAQTTNNSVQFGDVSVGSQMDMAMLTWAVESALRNAL